MAFMSNVPQGWPDHWRCGKCGFCSNHDIKDKLCSACREESMEHQEAETVCAKGESNASNV